MKRPLAAGYRAEVDTFVGMAWNDELAAFDDANIYQCWQLPDEVAAGKASRLLLKSGGVAVAAVEVRLFLVPFTQRGLAYVRWGPMWRRRGVPADTEHFRQALRAMWNEYVVRRGMVLRMNPRLFVEEHADLLRMLGEEGLVAMPSAKTERTVIVDLSAGLDALRAGVEKKWRGSLNKSDREGLTVVSGSDDQLFEEFGSLYAEMLQRKQFEPTADFDRHRALQRTLPEAARMVVTVARKDGQPCAAAIVSVVGDTAVFLFGATNELGMKHSGSYAVQWEVLKTLTARGIRLYDLHGINEEANPGTYRFKMGLAGKYGRVVTFAGLCQGFAPSITNYSLLFADGIRNRLRTARTRPASAPPATASDSAGTAATTQA